MPEYVAFLDASTMEDRDGPYAADAVIEVDGEEVEERSRATVTYDDTEPTTLNGEPAVRFTTAGSSVSIVVREHDVALRSSLKMLRDTVLEASELSRQLDAVLGRFRND